MVASARRGLSRRDFLKIASILPASLAGCGLRAAPTHVGARSNPGQPNFLIIVFDAMSANDLSVYGFHRKTTPNLERFAERAIQYHAHIAAGNYTTPGTASLLSGLYPWTHRAINLSGEIAGGLEKRSLFAEMGAEWTRYGYSQNAWAGLLLNQFAADIDVRVPILSFGAISPWLIADGLPDSTLAYRALDTFLLSKSEPAGSLLLGLADRMLGHRRSQRLESPDYPRGLPEAVTLPFYYEMETLFDGIIDFTAGLEPPFLAYLHLMPPHEPYRPARAYARHFDDEWRAPGKPAHRLVASPDTDERLNAGRQNYDRFIANLDAEFGRLMEAMEGAGLLDTTYVILTSDHGEMFERGERGHGTVLLYQPVIKIPLLIRPPGGVDPQHIHEPSGAVDVLPTVLSLAGRPVPAWCEGRVLPGLDRPAGQPKPVFSVEAKDNRAFERIRRGTVAMRKNGMKMIYYTGYERDDAFELYDVDEDPEELRDVYDPRSSSAAALADELLTTLRERDLPAA